jgi:hypothetical protein
MFNSFKNIFFGSKRIEEGISVWKYVPVTWPFNEGLIF